jgi:hypothetical protein
MSVTEIQAAITELTSDDLADLMNWLDDYQAKLWDKEIDEDLQAGRLEKVLAEVDKEGYATGYWERGGPRPHSVASPSIYLQKKNVRASRSMRARAPAFPVAGRFLNFKLTQYSVVGVNVWTRPSSRREAREEGSQVQAAVRSRRAWITDGRP